MIFQKHPQHGRHIAYSVLEAEANRKRGWKDVSKEDFYETVLPAHRVEEPKENPVIAPSQEGAPEDHQPPKRRGRRPKVNV